MKHKTNDSFWPLMLTVFLGTFAVMLSSSTINIALPFLMAHFHTNLDLVKWTMTGFMLAMGTTAPIAAYFGEKFSYKKLYIISILGFTVVSLSAVFANSIYALIAIRILQGCFGGVTIPATMALIYQVVPKEKQVLAVSLWNVAPTLAPAIGPTISGFLLQYFSWQSIFTINGIFGILTVLLSIRYLPYYKLSKHTDFDFMGIFLSLLTGTSLLIAFSEGALLGWTSKLILFMLVFGIVTMVLFVSKELKASSPALELKVFKYKRFTFGLFVSLIINVSLYAGTLITPIFLQQIQNMTPLKAGLLMLPPTMLMALFMPLAGKIYNKIGAFPMILCGVLMMFIGTFKMSFLEVHTSGLYIIFWMGVRYIGIAISTMPVNYVSIAVLPKELSGHASSIMNWMKQMFSCLSIGVFSSILTIRMNYHIHQKLLHTSISAKGVQALGSVLGINDVYFISCVIVLFALPFAFFMQKHQKQLINSAVKNESI